MTQQMPGPKHDDCSESLSRLIDGELDAAGCRILFDRLERDADARRAWLLLNVACDAVRSSETAALHSTAFVARVSTALEAEPVILAPGALRRRQVLVRRVGIPAAAVAAAVLVLAVVAVPQLRGTNAKPEFAGNPGNSVRQVAEREPMVDRSDALEAYLHAHRDGAAGPVTSRASDFIVPAAASTTEPR